MPVPTEHIIFIQENYEEFSIVAFHRMTGLSNKKEAEDAFKQAVKTIAKWPTKKLNQRRHAIRTWAQMIADSEYQALEVKRTTMYRVLDVFTIHLMIDYPNGSCAGILGPVGNPTSCSRGCEYVQFCTLTQCKKRRRDLWRYCPEYENCMSIRKVLSLPSSEAKRALLYLWTSVIKIHYQQHNKEGADLLAHWEE
ncbi:hypothetical protein BCR43DRAFT_259704 [Syncephalastrum racemosum]|uniref:Uncharacterized protein n=1 Tax=Syncephalastrum racemosum TaxID=13706 RepID=A0A1X2HGL4_SYNRA|nr:hypothetical protein BCR43DRAFT_259704 [Syncephalastrum racemosum]